MQGVGADQNSNVVDRGLARPRQAAGLRAYVYLHHAVDDHSRLAYSEILPDERKETAAAFWERARRFFPGHGITVKVNRTGSRACL